VTIVVENNIAELKRFRNDININTILFTELDGVLRFINLNSQSISTVVIDSCVDPEKVPVIAQYINSMFPHITTVEYCLDSERHKHFTHCIVKPFDEQGRSLLRELSGQAA